MPSTPYNTPYWITPHTILHYTPQTTLYCITLFNDTPNHPTLQHITPYCTTSYQNTPRHSMFHITYRTPLHTTQQFSETTPPYSTVQFSREIASRNTSQHVPTPPFCKIARQINNEHQSEVLSYYKSFKALKDSKFKRVVLRCEIPPYIFLPTVNDALLVLRPIEESTHL